MGKINFSPDLYLGVKEMSRMSELLDESGYKLFLKDMMVSSGIIKNASDTSFKNFRIDKDGVDSIKLRYKSHAVDSGGNLIVAQPFAGMNIPAGETKYVMVSYLESKVEVGKVSISASGEMTGAGTKFTNVLRGQPNRPSKIKFVDSGNNFHEYYVQEVISDTQAILLGQFVAETDLEFSVVGTFNPATSIPSSSKFPFRYDSAKIELFDWDASTPNRFVLAIADFSDVNDLVIIDKRRRFWTINSDFELSESANLDSIVGVYGVRWSDEFTPKHKNIIMIEWGFVATSWSHNTTDRSVTLNSGRGGRFKSINNTSNNDFIGWRVYFKDGSHRKCVSSVKDGSSLTMLLDLMTDGDVSGYNMAGDLIIVPDADLIQLRVSLGDEADENPNVDSITTHVINNASADIPVIVPSDSNSLFTILYRLSHNKEYSPWLLMPSDTDVGYYDESSFNGDVGTNATPDGVLNYDSSNRHLKTYLSHLTHGFIELVANPNSYHNVLRKFPVDLIGINRYMLSNSNPHEIFKVGENEYEQRIDGIDNPNGELASDHFIELSKDNAIEGSRFRFKLRKDAHGFSLNGHEFKFITDFVNATTYTTLLNFDQKLVDSIVNSHVGVTLEFIFDGVDWVAEVSFERCTKQGWIYETSGLNGWSLNPVSSISVDEFVEFHLYFRYRKICGGSRVEIEFFASGGSATSSKMFRMPEGFRPALNHVANAYSSLARRSGSLGVDTDGFVIVSGFTDGGSWELPYDAGGRIEYELS